LPNNSGMETTGRRLVYFAAERTFMAWIRVALALMALGFVIDRFGLVVRQLMPELEAQSTPPIFSFQVGIAFVILGILLNIAAGVRYLKFAIRYRREGSTEPGSGLSLGIVFAMFITVLGIGTAVYLMTFAD
jgi:putative membrane protein